VFIKWSLMVLWAVLLYIKEILDSLSAGRLAIRARIFLVYPRLS